MWSQLPERSFPPTSASGQVACALPLSPKTLALQSISRTGYGLTPRSVRFPIHTSSPSATRSTPSRRPAPAIGCPHSLRSSPVPTPRSESLTKEEDEVRAHLASQHTGRGWQLAGAELD